MVIATENPVHVNSTKCDILTVTYLIETGTK